MDENTESYQSFQLQSIDAKPKRIHIPMKMQLMVYKRAYSTILDKIHFDDLLQSGMVVAHPFHLHLFVFLV